MLIESGLPCEDCGSSDALSKYDNGTYCFSCCTNHRDVSKEGHAFALDRLYLPTNNFMGYNKLMPLAYDTKCHMFLMERHFTKEQIWFYQIKQTADDRFIGLPSQDYSAEYTEIRAIDENASWKYLTIGNKTKYYKGRCVLGESCSINPYIVLVEDILSAMRVGWDHACIALRGTKLSEESLLYLVSLSRKSKILLWLDNDEAGQRGVDKIKQKLAWIDFDIRTITTDKDPKWYTNNEINSIINSKLE